MLLKAVQPINIHIKLNYKQTNIPSCFGYQEDSKPNVSQNTPTSSSTFKWNKFTQKRSFYTKENIFYEKQILILQSLS